MKTQRQEKQQAVKESLLKRRVRMAKRNPEKSSAFANRWQRIEDKKNLNKFKKQG